MPLATTTIGAWPKPEYVRLPDWFKHPDGPDTADPTRGWAAAMEALGDDAEAVIARGVAEAIEHQVGAGIDIPTDGEIAREDYIHYHCRHLDGVNFDWLEERHCATTPTAPGCPPSTDRCGPVPPSFPPTTGAPRRAQTDRSRSRCPAR